MSLLLRACKSLFLTAVLALAACGTANPLAPGDVPGALDAADPGDARAGLDAPPGADGAPDVAPTWDVTQPGEGGVLAGLRGQRYCEVLLITLASGSARVDVYNTIGVSDCPEAQWSALDPNALRAATMSTLVQLNGPRYWLIDALANSSLLDPTVRVFGGIPMRLAGRIEEPASTLTMASQAYVRHSVMRDTQWVFAAGGMVYELVDPTGAVFVMQSYSTQTTAQTEASLGTLASRLTLPAGWSYRARALDAELRVTAIGGVATVVRDDFQNTYQLSQ